MELLRFFFSLRDLQEKKTGMAFTFAVETFSRFTFMISTTKLIAEDGTFWDAKVTKG